MIVEEAIEDMLRYTGACVDRLRSTVNTSGHEYPEVLWAFMALDPYMRDLDSFMRLIADAPRPIKEFRRFVLDMQDFLRKLERR